MISLQRAGFRVAGALALLAIVSSNATAQATPLPTAEEVMERFVTVTGLRKMFDGHTSIRTTAKMEIAGSGITGTVVALKVKPDRMVQTTTIPGIGDATVGFDGKIGWVTDPLRGPRLLVDDELADMALDADFRSALRDTSRYAVRENVGVAELGGESCYRIRLVTGTGRETFECYSVTSGLLVASQRKVKSQDAAVDVTLLLSDYKEFAGVKFAGRVVQEQLGRQRVLTLESVTFDDARDEEHALPPEVKALIRP
jgi:hypothetical protein